jgi:hypothetical protein
MSSENLAAHRAPECRAQEHGHTRLPRLRRRCPSFRRGRRHPRARPVRRSPRSSAGPANANRSHARDVSCRTVRGVLVWVIQSLGHGVATYALRHPQGSVVVRVDHPALFRGRRDRTSRFARGGARTSADRCLARVDQTSTRFRGAYLLDCVVNAADRSHHARSGPGRAGSSQHRAD